MLWKVMNREEKIQIMKQALAIEMGGFQEYEVFNTFYAEDLIAFGIKNNIPEAIRLGEIMMSENGATMSKQLNMAIKDYKMSYNVDYAQAIKKTGPI